MKQIASTWGVVVRPSQMEWLWYHLHYNTFCLIMGGLGTTSTKVGCSITGSCGTSSTKVACSSTSVASGTNSTKVCCFTNHKR